MENKNLHRYGNKKLLLLILFSLAILILLPQVKAESTEPASVILRPDGKIMYKTNTGLFISAGTGPDDIIIDGETGNIVFRGTKDNLLKFVKQYGKDISMVYDEDIQGYIIKGRVYDPNVGTTAQAGWRGFGEHFKDLGTGMLMRGAQFSSLYLTAKGYSLPAGLSEMGLGPDDFFKGLSTNDIPVYGNIKSGIHSKDTLEKIGHYSGAVAWGAGFAAGGLGKIGYNPALLGGKVSDVGGLAEAAGRHKGTHDLFFKKERAIQLIKETEGYGRIDDLLRKADISRLGFWESGRRIRDIPYRFRYGRWPKSQEVIDGLWVESNKIKVYIGWGRSREGIARTLVHEGGHQYLHELKVNPPGFLLRRGQSFKNIFRYEGLQEYHTYRLAARFSKRVGLKPLANPYKAAAQGRATFGQYAQEQGWAWPIERIK